MCLLFPTTEARLPHPTMPMPLLGIHLPASGANWRCLIPFAAALLIKAKAGNIPAARPGYCLSKFWCRQATECSGPDRSSPQAMALRQKEQGAEQGGYGRFHLYGGKYTNREHFWKAGSVAGFRELGGWGM